jgi:hypothetical protein
VFRIVWQWTIHPNSIAKKADNNAAVNALSHQIETCDRDSRSDSRLSVRLYCSSFNSEYTGNQESGISCERGRFGVASKKSYSGWNGRIFLVERGWMSQKQTKRSTSWWFLISIWVGYDTPSDFEDKKNVECYFWLDLNRYVSNLNWFVCWLTRWQLSEDRTNVDMGRIETHFAECMRYMQILSDSRSEEMRRSPVETPSQRVIDWTTATISKQRISWAVRATGHLHPRSCHDMTWHSACALCQRYVSVGYSVESLLLWSLESAIVMTRPFDR